MNTFPYTEFPNDNRIYVFMVRSYSFLAKCIRFFMRIKQLVLRKSVSEICNHADIYIGDGIVVGAERRGVYPKTVRGIYHDGKRRDIFVYNVPLNSTLSAIVKSWSLEQAGKKYEFSNFINQIYRILYITFKGREKWLGHRGEGAQKRYFCSEFVSTAICQVRPDFSLSPWDDDPMDLKELCESKLIYLTTIKLKNDKGN